VQTEKEMVQELIAEMPDDVSAETIVSELEFRLTILRRGADAEQGKNLVSHEEVKRRLAKWFDSPGT
jgi:hypothetical protein